jgi:hypothetical protein
VTAPRGAHAPASFATSLSAAEARRHFAALQRFPTLELVVCGAVRRETGFSPGFLVDFWVAL